MPVSTLGERIRGLRRAQGITQKAFADSLGIAQGYLSSIERGRQIPSDTLLIALSHLYQVDERWLRTGDGVLRRSASPPSLNGNAAGVPLLRSVPAEFPEELSPENILDYVLLPDTRPGTYAFRAYGDFMSPTIQDGDLILFSPGGEAEGGDIVMVKNKWGDLLLRRYRLRDDGVWLSPDNSAYTPFQPDADFRIYGVVTGVWRKVKL